MRWPRVLGIAGLALIAGLILAWVLTPPVADAQRRVAELARQEKVPLVQFGDVPPQLAEAVISIEDERFYQDHGIDVIGIGRAMLFDATHRCLCEGGSTIDEQLVKDLYLGGNDRGPSKLEDMVLAIKLQTIMAKPQILADYVSIITTGPGLYGVAAAACTYYGLGLDHLNLAQDALLAGLTQDPALYDPLQHPGAARARRQEVLSAMLADGYITGAQQRSALAAPISAAPAASRSCDL